LPLFAYLYKFMRQVPFCLQVLLLVLCLHWPCSLDAQGEDKNQNKYWHYRHRLVHDFMVVGSEPGQSIPAGVRNLWNGSGLHFGDAPVYIGYYIGVLATEYSLLKTSGANTDQTLTELYYALEALNRLDDTAEKYWNPGETKKDRNGFMLECDVPADFCKRYDRELNFSSNAVARPSVTQMAKVDYIEAPSSPERRMMSTCSQDHLACLLMGLALDVKYMSDSLHFRDCISGQEKSYLFRSMGLEISTRIMEYIHRGPYGGSRWTLHVPDGRRISNGKGGNALFNSYGFAKAGYAITGKKYEDFSCRITHFYWKSIYIFPFFTRLHPDDMLFGLELSAIGDSWNGGAGRKSTLSRIQRVGNYAGGMFYADNKYGWDLFYGSVYCLLHDSAGAAFRINTPEVFRTILDAAPYSGPYFHGAKELPEMGWAGSSGRFYDHPPNQLLGKEQFQGNYNGLDYMLFYNMYRLLELKNGRQVPQEQPYFISPEFKPGY
jgi:hypothetical protein